ncbi:MAG: GAF domain-containing protein, partial [Anaerolineales bacterium]|nr:GAF domain-containing protein [Anaerolineales bacterium]
MQSKTLLYQLEKLALDDQSPPSPEKWQLFLQQIHSAYNEYEQNLSANKLINDLLAKASSILNPIETLEIICRELAQYFGVPQSAVAMLNPEETEAHVVAEYLEEGRPSGLGLVFSLVDDQATKIVLKTHKPLFIQNVQTDPLMESSREALAFRGTVTMMIAPIMVGGKVIGTFGLDSLTERCYTPSDIDLIKRAMTTAGQVLSNAQLYAKLQDELYARKQAESELSSLYRAATQLLTYTNLEELAQQIADNLVDEFDFADCSVLLLDNLVQLKNGAVPRQEWATNKLTRKAFKGHYEHDVAPLIPLDGQGLIATAVRTNQVIYSPDV